MKSVIFFFCQCVERFGCFFFVPEQLKIFGFFLFIVVKVSNGDLFVCLYKMCIFITFICQKTTMTLCFCRIAFIALTAIGNRVKMIKYMQLMKLYPFLFAFHPHSIHWLFNFIPLMMPSVKLALDLKQVEIL